MTLTLVIFGFVIVSAVLGYLDGRMKRSVEQMSKRIEGVHHHLEMCRGAIVLTDDRIGRITVARNKEIHALKQRIEAVENYTTELSNRMEQQS